MSGAWYDSGDYFVDHRLGSGDAQDSVAMLAHALRNRGTYGHEKFPAGGSRLTGEPAEWVSAALCQEGDPFLAVDARDEENRPVRVVAWRDGALLFVSQPDDARVAMARAFASTAARMSRLRDLVSGWVEPVKQEPRRVATDVLMLARVGTAYAFRPIGSEADPLVRDNYPEVVLRGFDAVLAQLVAKEPSGRMAIFEGEPGTGKTRMVRALLAGMGGRCDAVVVPSHLVAQLSGPDLIGALLGRPRPVVLVLEDADYSLLSREHADASDRAGSTAALSAVLNLSDGIVGSKVDLRIVATTNARIEHVDAALLRPGRLIERVHVGPLAAEHAARVIAREAGPAAAEAAPRLARDGMTLAEAYEAGRRAAAAS